MGVSEGQGDVSVTANGRFYGGTERPLANNVTTYLADFH